MARLGQLLVASYCDHCGFTKAAVTEQSADRCTSCGRFVEDQPEVCCARHEVKESPYPSGICPRCEQERSMKAQEQEMHQRRADPRMHPTVDAPRY